MAKKDAVDAPKTDAAPETNTLNVTVDPNKDLTAAPIDGPTTDLAKVDETVKTDESASEEQKPVDQAQASTDIAVDPVEKPKEVFSPASIQTKDDAIKLAAQSPIQPIAWVCGDGATFLAENEADARKHAYEFSTKLFNV
jgi:hypothetical protein